MSSHELLRIDPAQSVRLPEADTHGVGIIGAGKVGLSIGFALNRLNMLRWMVVRSRQQRLEVSLAFQDVQLYADANEIEVLPDIIMICVPDHAIESVAGLLAEHYGNALGGVVVMHCAGSRGPDVLRSCEECGASVVAAHPYQTFHHAHERLLYSIAWGIECDSAVEAQVSSFIRLLSGTPVILSEFTRQHRELYHASAVVASNYLEALIATARDAAAVARIQPMTFLRPIIQTAVDTAMMNLVHSGSPALTGPIARGDVQTVQMHLSALKQFPSLCNQYCYFGMATAQFALREAMISQAVCDELEELFKESRVESE